MKVDKLSGDADEVVVLHGQRVDRGLHGAVDLEVDAAHRRPGGGVVVGRVVRVGRVGQVHVHGPRGTGARPADDVGRAGIAVGRGAGAADDDGRGGEAGGLGGGLSGGPAAAAASTEGRSEGRRRRQRRRFVDDVDDDLRVVDEGVRRVRLRVAVRIVAEQAEEVGPRRRVEGGRRREVGRVCAFVVEPDRQRGEPSPPWSMPPWSS